MTNPAFHLADDVLLDYGAGNLDESVSLLVACHLTLCPRCRATAGEFDAIGGQLIETLRPQAAEADALQRAFAQIGDDSAPNMPASTDAAAPGTSILTPLPTPLQAYVGTDMENLAWKRLMRGVHEFGFETGDGEFKSALLRIGAGCAVPEHTHRGGEFTLVLEGAFSDHVGHYVRGDVTYRDDGVRHKPKADDDGDCLCLTAVDAPLRLTGPVGRMLNPFLKL